MKFIVYLGLILKNLNKPMSAFFNCVHPEDREYVNHAINETFNGKPLTLIIE